ncbi:MAG: SMC-Scp complex subunit ScpB [Planctomycetaceae bacterium]
MTTDFAEFADRSAEAAPPEFDDSAAESGELDAESVGAGTTDFDAELDLEAAYRRALAAVEAAEQEVGHALVDLADDAGEDDARADDESEDQSGERAADGAIIEMPAERTGSESSRSVESHSSITTNVDEERARRLHPRRIIEAALFVGGAPLTTRKLRSLLRDEFDADVIERLIDELNTEYGDENRPYEIRFGEGGFRLSLRDEHERLRNRVFGQAPKEVRLSQEALEVLALVAYRQPLGREEIETLGGKDPAGILRQLIRRELVALERDDHSPPRVRYRTTPRFLQVFGLASIDELPRAEDLEFK